MGSKKASKKKVTKKVVKKTAKPVKKVKYATREEGRAMSVRGEL